MAENYVPSSSQQGQGGAQILRGQTPRLSASGIVRGIEQAGQTLREEEKYKREKEALAQREKNAKIDALDESITSIQIPKLQYAGERAVEDFWSNIDKGEDFNSAYKELTSGLNYLTTLSNNLVKEKPAIIEGEFRYEDGTTLDGKQGFSNLMEKGFNENQEEIYKQGGIESLGASVMSESSLMSNDFYEPSKHSFTETLSDYVVSKFKTNAQETASILNLGGKTGVKTKRAFKSPEQIRKDLINNPEIFELYKRARTDAYRAEGKQEQLKADYDAYIDNYKLPEEVTVGYITKDTEGEGDITEQDLAVARKVKQMVNKFQDSREPSVINELIKPYGLSIDINKESGTITLNKLNTTGSGEKRITSKDIIAEGLDINNADAIYRLLDEYVPDIKLEALGKVEFKDPTPESGGVSTGIEVKDDSVYEIDPN